MTPTAGRLASLAGSSCCYAEADRLLAELAGVNYGAKARRRRPRGRAGDAGGGGGSGDAAHDGAVGIDHGAWRRHRRAPVCTLRWTARGFRCGPDAVRVVDFFHAAEHPWAAARDRYGPDNDLAKP